MKDLNFLANELKKKSNTWLITGVAGFIGSNLLEFLLKTNQKVIGLDNFSTGFKHNLDQVRDIVGLEKWSNFNFIEGDLRDLEVCQSACKGVDFILHQGALGSVPRSIANPIASNDNNVNGTLNIFISGRDHNIKRIIFASSSSVYGDDLTLPKVESIVGNPLSPYAITKKVKELYAKVFSEQYGIEILGIRYFNVFGQRQNPEGAYAAVIPKWVKSLIKNEEVFIYGDGETSRDFTHIDNVIALNIIACLHEEKISPGTIINGALGDTTSLNQLLKILVENLKSSYPHLKEFKPTYKDFRAGDIKDSMANMNKASEILNYKPLVKIDEGIKKTLSWYSSNIV